MIAFKYTKTDSAEFLSHLDLLRHVYRTLRRAQIPVAMSEGYHAHARIFLNNPLPVGVRSVMSVIRCLNDLAVRRMKFHVFISGPYEFYLLTIGRYTCPA